MVLSTVEIYTAQVSSGSVFLSTDGSSLLVGQGTSAQLVRSSTLYLYWLTSAGTLRRATVADDLTLGTVTTLATNVSSFYAIDMAGRGMAYAYVSNNTITIDLLDTSFTASWPSDRLPDFSFDVSTDMTTISVLYRRPGSPIQAFVETYDISETQLTAVAPTFTPAGGSHLSSVTITMSSPTPNKTIRYTTDGTTPTSASPIYRTPITLTSSATVQAYTSAPGYLASPVSSASYIVTIPVPDPEPHVSYQASRLRVYDFKMGLYTASSFLSDTDI